MSSEFHGLLYGINLKRGRGSELPLEFVVGQAEVWVAQALFCAWHLSGDSLLGSCVRNQDTQTTWKHTLKNESYTM